MVDRLNKRVTVNYGFMNNKTVTTDLEGENVSYLGTHVKINQTILLTPEVIQKISDRQFINWNKQHQNIDNSPFLCCICYENMRNVVFSPCNHLCMCSICSGNDLLRRCLLCNMDIRSKMFVYV